MEDVRAFLAECTRSVPGGNVLASTLHDHFARWCGERRIALITLRQFITSMGYAGHEITRLDLGGRGFRGIYIVPTSASQPVGDGVQRAFQAWLDLPEEERTQERPWIQGFNAGWEAALSAPMPEDQPAGDGEEDPCPNGEHCCCCGPGQQCCDCGHKLIDLDRETALARWTDFLDDNPDDLTSSEDLPDHALVTFEQFFEMARDILPRIAISAALSTDAGQDEAADEYVRIENAECNGMDKGADFCIKTLAKALGVDDWEQADGSETWHGDVAGTIYNVLKAGRVYDDEDGRVARLEDAPTTDAVGLREALQRLEQAEANYRRAHDLYGAGSREAGRAWDVMRQAGDQARAILAKGEGA